MSALNERIKKLRRYFDLTQQEFADRLGTTRNNIAGYETGRRLPSEAVISLICRECNVNEHWLRTGEGGMFVPDVKDTLGAFIRERNLTTTDRILIEKFVSLSVKARWEVVRYVLDIADALYEECRASVQQRTELDTTGQERAEVDSATKVAGLERQNQELAAKVTESSRPESPAPDRAKQEQTQLNNESVGIQDAAPTFAPTHMPTIEEEARAEAEQHTEALYEQILFEKKAAAGMLSESSEPKAGGGMARQA